MDWEEPAELDCSTEDEDSKNERNMLRFNEAKTQRKKKRFSVVIARRTADATSPWTNPPRSRHIPLNLSLSLSLNRKLKLKLKPEPKPK